ncbi:MAG TPA: ATP-binding cassette domain-containing protein, partial [Acidimicrobiales bacterium]|nr:ATP-binding cassette domain-containing protein [Acidimicrobiales bacterium]
MLLELHDVHVHYGQVEAIKGISLEVDYGEIVTLIGGNGAGKTTTLKTISGVRPLSSGRVVFEGEEITGRPPHELVERGLCQAPEGRGIFPGMSVIENLEMGAYSRRAKRGALSADLSRVFDLFP